MVEAEVVLIQAVVLEELLEEPHELHEPVILGDQVVHEEQTLEAVVDEQDSIR